MSGYCPSAPYKIGQGKRIGDFLELMMFTDYAFLVWWLKQLNKWSRGSKNDLHLHLEWLIRRGEKVMPSMLCPWCKERPVRFFFVHRIPNGDCSISPLFVSCDNPDCFAKPQGQAFRFRFSSMKVFRRKINRNQLAKLFRIAFRLPQRLTPRAAFDFFADSTSQTPHN